MHAILLLIAGLSLGRSTQGPTEVAEAIRRAFVANLDGPAYGTITFRLVEGVAVDANAARRGDLADPVVAKGSYTFDGRRGHYQCVFPVATMASRRFRMEDGRWATQLTTSGRAITDGTLSLYDLVYVDKEGASETHTAQIEPGVAVYARAILLPIAPRVPERRSDSLDRMVQTALHESVGGYRLVSVAESVRLDDVDTVLLTFEAGTGDDFSRLEYWVDLVRGALPLKIQTTTGTGRSSTVSQVHFDDIRWAGGKCWLPFQMTAYLINNKYARQYIIEGVDFEERPPRSAFRLEFPWPRPMINAATMVRYAPRTVWDLSELPPTTSRETTRIQLQEPAVRPPPMPGVRPERRWWPGLLLALIGVALLAAAAASWRRRRHV